MERLRRSFRDSFRKHKKNTHKNNTLEISKPIEWQADEIAVKSGSCNFQVKYLGCTEVFESRGMQVCEEAFKVLKRGTKKPIRSVLHVSGEALRVVDKDSKILKFGCKYGLLKISAFHLQIIDLDTNGLIVDQTIEKVSFCAPDRNYDRGFSYICRDGATRRWLCHGFMAYKYSKQGPIAMFNRGARVKGERLSHAVGCAFAACLERKQARDRACAVAAKYEGGLNKTTFTRYGSFMSNSSSPQQLTAVKQQNMTHSSNHQLLLDTAANQNAHTTTNGHMTSTTTAKINERWANEKKADDIIAQQQQQKQPFFSLLKNKRHLFGRELSLPNGVLINSPLRPQSHNEPYSKSFDKASNTAISSQTNAMNGSVVGARQRPPIKMDLLRQASFRCPHLSSKKDFSPFKKQLSLRLTELPSTLERIASSNEGSLTKTSPQNVNYNTRNNNANHNNTSLLFESDLDENADTLSNGTSCRKELDFTENGPHALGRDINELCKQISSNFPISPTTTNVSQTTEHSPLDPSPLAYNAKEQYTTETEFLKNQNFNSSKPIPPIINGNNTNSQLYTKYDSPSPTFQTTHLPKRNKQPHANHQSNSAVYSLDSIDGTRKFALEKHSNQNMGEKGHVATHYYNTDNTKHNNFNGNDANHESKQHNFIINIQNNLYHNSSSENHSTSYNHNHQGHTNGSSGTSGQMNQPYHFNKTNPFLLSHQYIVPSYNHQHRNEGEPYDMKPKNLHSHNIGVIRKEYYHAQNNGGDYNINNNKRSTADFVPLKRADDEQMIGASVPLNGFYVTRPFSRATTNPFLIPVTNIGSPS